MNTEFERIEVLHQPVIEDNRFTRFKEDFGNINFRKSFMTYISLCIILLFAAQGLMGDQTLLLDQLNETLRLIIYFFTIILQWALIGIIYFATFKEKTLFEGVGVIKIRGIDFAWGFALLLSLFAVASGVAFVLTQLNMPPIGELGMLLPETLPGKIVWVGVSFTAGFCEEVIFRGYLMTRLRFLGKFKSWTIPVIVSSLAFGFPHLYQGLPGFIIISILGVLFALVYIRTRSLWPCIIAHFFLDFLALFIPQ